MILQKVTIMQTCKTCIFWTKDITKSNWRISGGICTSKKLTEDSDYAADSLVYSYDEGGSFWTGPEFGCVHHKEREINKKTKICPDCGASFYHEGICGKCKGKGYIQ